MRRLKRRRIGVPTRPAVGPPGGHTVVGIYFFSAYALCCRLLVTNHVLNDEIRATP